MKQYFAILTALALTAALLCPTAGAAGGPTLRVDKGSETGTTQLTLQNLGDREINSVQLELTLWGSYPQASFAGDENSGSYSYCKVDASSRQTTVTIYIDSVKTLNQSGTAPLGTLTLGSGYAAPSSARLTVLDHGLSASPEGSIPVQADPDIPTGQPPENNTTNPSSPSDSSNSDEYLIRTVSAGHGKVSVSPGRAERGERVTITTRADSGYRLSELTATAGGRQLELSDRGEGRFTFTMPGSAVEVQGTFAASEPAGLPFTDVAKDIWYHDAVRYAYENGLMAGTSVSTFSPDLATSRGMIVTILYRLAGSPNVGGSDFYDVAAGKYYSDAVAWAAANSVVSGYGDGRFGPDDPITREQMTLILQGYARLEGRDVSARADLSAYTDAGKVSGYALESMRWARAVGLINGTTPTTLTPAGTATRAQAAVILQGFCENVVSGE